MANWCSNTVVFEGCPEAIEQIEQLFRTMAEKEKQNECGQLPDFVSDENGGYFFDLYPQDNETGIYHYETRWSPNTEILQQIAERYKADFVHDYEQMGCLIYGRAIFSDELLTDIYLEDEFEQYEYDDETDTYRFEGNEHESNCEILETLLERKIKNSLTTLKIQSNESIR